MPILEFIPDNQTRVGKYGAAIRMSDGMLVYDAGDGERELVAGVPTTVEWGDIITGGTPGALGDDIPLLLGDDGQGGLINDTNDGARKLYVGDLTRTLALGEVRTTAENIGGSAQSNLSAYDAGDHFDADVKVAADATSAYVEIGAFDNDNDQYAYLDVNHNGTYDAYMEGAAPVFNIHDNLHVINPFSTPSAPAAEESTDETGTLTAVTPNNAGTGYEEDDVLTVAGGTGGTVNVDSVDMDGAITGLSILTAGSGYVEDTGVALSGGAGSGATGDILATSTPNSGDHEVGLLIHTAAGTVLSATTTVSSDGAHAIDVPVPDLSVGWTQIDVVMSQADASVLYVVAEDVTPDDTYQIDTADGDLTDLAPTVNTAGGNLTVDGEIRIQDGQTLWGDTARTLGMAYLDGQLRMVYRDPTTGFIFSSIGMNSVAVDLYVQDASDTQDIDFSILPYQATFQLHGAGTKVVVAGGQTTIAAATTSYPSLNIPAGTAPTSKTNGDVWGETAAIHVYINGAEYTLDMTAV